MNLGKRIKRIETPERAPRQLPVEPPAPARREAEPAKQHRRALEEVIGMPVVTPDEPSRK